MAYVIAVCGSGGKTTLCKALATKYANENEKVCITTTTNMWFDDDVRENFFDISSVCLELDAKDIAEKLAVGVDTIHPSYSDEATFDCFMQAKQSMHDKVSLGHKLGKVYFAGHEDKKKSKLIPLSTDEYDKLCKIFDCVIIEADGSRSMPMKIPYGIGMNSTVGADTICPNNRYEACEPIIPDNVNEIIIVVGMEAIGRKIGYICHRFNEFYGKDKFLSDNNITANTKVDETLIDKFVNYYYVEPLNSKFPKTEIKIYKNNYCNMKINNKNDEIIEPVLINRKDIPKRICITLCASGFSKRFGDENKLLLKFQTMMHKVNDIVDNRIGCIGEDKLNVSANICKAHCRYKNNEIKLYQLMIEKMLFAKKEVSDKLSKDLLIKDLQIDIVVVSQYDEILNDSNYQKEVIFLKNENAGDGLSSSIKLAVEKYKDYDAIVFLNSDMPNLSKYEFAGFIFNSILNNNKMASMFTDMPKNPAYFEKEYFDEILKIGGDKGLKELLDKNIKDLYRYYIDPNQLFEIDTKEDLKKFNDMQLNEIFEG